jgi:hypothetical protein
MPNAYCVLLPEDTTSTIDARRFEMKAYLALGIALVVAAPSIAAGAPAQLLGRTVNVSFNMGGSAKTESGSVVSASRHVTQVIYISSAGRIFARSAQTAQTGSVVQERAPGETLWHFANGRLIFQRRAISGAFMGQISFGSSFQTCDVSGIVGHESGKPIIWRGLNGKTFESVGPMSISDATCSVSTGNGL